MRNEEIEIIALTWVMCESHMYKSIVGLAIDCFFFFSSRRRHTRLQGDWSSDVCSSDLLTGLERHPHLADAHDLYARILADKHDFERAFDEWDMALRVAPDHVGALK